MYTLYLKHNANCVPIQVIQSTTETDINIDSMINLTV